MAEVTLNIGGFSYQLACRDGEEAHLARLGEMVDRKVQQARSAVGNASEVRQLLLSALLFADELIESGRPPSQSAQQPQAPPRPTIDPALLEDLADRAEALAAKLESVAGSH